MLLKQQKISARISNHPSHNRLTFGEVTGVRSVCFFVPICCEPVEQSRRGRDDHAPFFRDEKSKFKEKLV